MSAVTNSRHRTDSWTAVEVELLNEGVEAHGRNWSRVAQCVLTRNANACETKFYRMQHGPYKRSDEYKWSDGENKKLFRLFIKHGPDWKKIGKKLKNLSAKKCHSQWMKILEDRRIFTHEEAKVLEYVVTPLTDKIPKDYNGSSKKLIKKIARQLIQEQTLHVGEDVDLGKFNLKPLEFHDELSFSAIFSPIMENEVLDPAFAFN